MSNLNVQHIVAVKELVEKSNIVLPTSLVNKKIEIANPDAITEYDFFMQYDADKKSLLVRYMTCDNCYHDFWDYRYDGKLVDGEMVI